MTLPRLEDARTAARNGNILKAEQIYSEILELKSADTYHRNENLIDMQETGIQELGELYRDNNNEEKLVELVSKARHTMGAFAKSKTAKIIKNLIDLIEHSNFSDALSVTIKTTMECIDWAIDEKRTFLRQALQIRLASLFYKNKQYMKSLSEIAPLLREFKKLDDKSSLVEVQLLESKNYFQLKNHAKSKAAITSARTSANAIYCPSQLQAELDLMSGVLHAEDKDFSTAFSYFYEAFENYQIHSNEEKTIKVLKYMLLCKIMLNSIDDVNSLLNNKNVSKYAQGKDIEAMKSVSMAHSNRSLKELEDCLKSYVTELTQDPIIRSHLADLYDSLFQKNLLKLIEPYSCIEISHISSMIGLPKNIIESKLSNMILDKVFYGVLDQGNGWLIIYEEPFKDEMYDLNLNVIRTMSNVVDLLYEKASLLE
ncbi:hypothetical protein KL909_003139 [Ogataea angusta]|uniref:PCI domain-containing protein n=1 Tax=Pichia angusta TaxID=870730 RepID=A0AAN6DBW9_PICAN|nr:uncharacterized protein KL928_004161 [Ogataea angusta]KAG7816697.1 hypothetical protein KL928_004161 [Ogataea angusta]KAG7823116.1 hypothetical protein KL909_003139 [Ogataea angusta]